MSKKIKSILATDCGSTTTKSILIEKIDGEKSRLVCSSCTKNELLIIELEEALVNLIPTNPTNPNPIYPIPT